MAGLSHKGLLMPCHTQEIINWQEGWPEGYL